jgi:hypothetical protein
MTVTIRGGIGKRRLLAQMAAVLEPLARRYAGAQEAAIRPALCRAWRDEFGTDLPEPTRGRCVTAIASGRSWQSALWSDD